MLFYLLSALSAALCLYIVYKNYTINPVWTAVMGHKKQKRGIYRIYVVVWGALM
jgi:hypothetical protein